MPLAVCATPIGNLEDVTLRVLRELAAADVVLCEDTRRTRRLLARHSIAARLVSYHEHNEARRTAEAIERLRAGERVALVSDAGLPSISDPGARLVGAAREAGVEVTVLPGPSAVETAVVASGFAVERYRFVGFVPRGGSALRELLGSLGEAGDATVAFESPQRLTTTLRVLDELMPERRLAVCRELTKQFEEVAIGCPAELGSKFSAPPRGEITLVLEPMQDAREEREDVETAAAAVGELVASGASRRTAVEVVAELTGVARNRLYTRVL